MWRRKQSKSSIGDLKDTNGETEDKAKVEILSVLTVEGDSELPDFELKVNEKDNIDIICIKPEKCLNN